MTPTRHPETKILDKTELTHRHMDEVVTLPEVAFTLGVPKSSNLTEGKQTNPKVVHSTYTHTTGMGALLQLDFSLSMHETET